MMAPLQRLAEQVRENRRPAAADNPFVAMQEKASRADRHGARPLAGHERGARRTDVPGDLRLAGPAGRRRHRSGGDGPLRKCGQEPAPSRAVAEADRRAQVAHSGSAGCAKPSSAALLFAGMTRAAVDERGFEIGAPHPPGAMATCRLRGVQGAGARAVPHAADRSGSGAGRHPVDASRPIRRPGARLST